MPRSLEPGAKFPIVLDGDAKKPASERPTFYARSLSMRQQEELSHEFDASFDKSTAAEIFDATCELLKKHLIGWENMGPFEFGKCELKDLLSSDEARELLRKILANQFLKPDEKKD